MKFKTTAKFREDHSSLSARLRQVVKESRPTLEAALQGDAELYQLHRIKRMKGHRNIWEGHLKYNLVFTMHFETNSAGERVCVFRRIGTHGVYDKP